jgi:hypothetical protein
MAADDDEIQTAPENALAAPVPRRWRWWRVVLGAMLLLALGLAVAWFGREQIADNLIARQLDGLGLPVTYEVEQIGTDEQVLRKIVIGDPARPDLTIARARVQLLPRWGVPALGRITLEKARLYGRYRGGKLSFGSLDPLIFTGSKEPFRLPDLDIALIDGRGLLDSDYGPVGIKLEGTGRLRDGFAGTVAAVMPQVTVAGCRAGRSSIYGSLSVSNEKPHFAGPVRLASLDCPDLALQLGEAGMQLDSVLDTRFDGGEGKFSLFGQRLASREAKLASANLDASFAYRKSALTARYALAGKGLDLPQVQLAILGSNGMLRAQEGFARIEVEGDLAGNGLRLSNELDRALAGAGQVAAGSFAAPLIERLRSGLQREGQASRFTASFIHRQTGAIVSS